jgi:hypothetical protein
MTKEWINDDHDLFENDGEKTVQKWTVGIEMESPDGITHARLTRIVSRALSDSNYLYDEVSSSSVSATLELEESVTVESTMLDRRLGKKIKSVKSSKKIKAV